DLLAAHRRDGALVPLEQLDRVRAVCHGVRDAALRECYTCAERGRCDLTPGPAVRGGLGERLLRLAERLRRSLGEEQLGPGRGDESAGRGPPRREHLRTAAGQLLAGALELRRIRLHEDA